MAQSDARAVFLDRDGVINLDRPDYVKHLGEFSLLPGAAEAVARLTTAGWRVVITTNQAAIGKGLMGDRELARIHEHMLTEIEKMGGRISAIYHCPHRPDENCPCRKPKPGLLERAAREMGLHLPACYLVGDRMRDIQAGAAVGCTTLLIKPPGTKEELTDSSPDAVVKDLSEAVDWLLARECEQENISSAETK
ncbi:MAG: D-glycero-beta-D-manno-heptose 1,7-bisphosphate 7-phosphatase [Armatimonadetes bacterium]|nr:D-glycero-beta-D-manno-heptose 1,7-bisphosphate 7-phosphatase [Armatimonadota bacterium]NIM24649.1 D-glycero-beta-D-manno-heptose 1,7-bisphosphate 7-phosphatase [Armatimonadota bacterium]NIM68528.1 D-glycero-beta-D-manno-heptose 1,7-bisphosphate 7-phosphatase [Armatimonadota bacterium]NIM76910.1 D-glycero-beta-D-manno-heptose 1,7-bisphosphate 7-phosphatase [Armatimonadota bacterium]NIN06722.1 D-glycero-beta-D-manno-heptose 1,7-bisphosphate 7-phosphatase [Armatimonadota bacterium]